MTNIVDNSTDLNIEESISLEPTTKFADYELPATLLTAIDKLGFTNPTKVQESTLNAALAGDDLMVSAQTGSGKTVAFLLPCLASVINSLPPEHSRHKKARPQVLVVCPTRELVQQVFQDAVNLIKDTKGIRVASVMGGMSYPKQIAGLKGAQVVIATPGRLLDLQSKNNISLDYVSHLVLDEADRMLDLGFSEALASIAHLCQKREQTLLFSATFAENIVHLATKLMNNPTRIELANSQDKHADITQALYWADDEDHKQALLLHWLNTEAIDQAVIFAPTKVETERLALALRKAGQSVVDLHGGMQQFMRTKQIKKLRDGKAKILVATDVAARGLDVPSISHVFNYGVPMKNDDYVHRIGRTGRAGKKGKAITVATHRERARLIELQHFIEQDIDVHEVAGMEPTPYRPRRDNRSNNGKSRRRGKPRPNQYEREGNRNSRYSKNGGKGGFGKGSKGKSGDNDSYGYQGKKGSQGKGQGKVGAKNKAQQTKQGNVPKPNLKRTNAKNSKAGKGRAVKEEVFGTSKKIVKGFKAKKPKNS